MNFYEEILKEEFIEEDDVASEMEEEDEEAEEEEDDIEADNADKNANQQKDKKLKIFFHSLFRKK